MLVGQQLPRIIFNRTLDTRGPFVDEETLIGRTTQLSIETLASTYAPYEWFEEELRRLFPNIGNVGRPKPSAEDIMEDFKRNGKDYEYCPELENGEIPPQNARRARKNKKPIPTECVFCKNNGEEISFYKTHLAKDPDTGKTTCPILRAYTCPICGAKGDGAHTVKYCKLNKNPEIIATFNTMKVMRNSAGKRRYSK